MRQKNGFTLVELLAAIALLGVIATIIIYNTIGLTNDSKDLQYERLVENIENATQTYVSLYPEDFSDLYSSKAFTYITLAQLVNAGLLDEDTTNPYTNEEIDLTEEVKIYVDGSSYEMTYVYPVTEADRNSETWLSTQTLTVNVNSAFSIYSGIGTNALSLADENGTLLIDYESAGVSSLTAYYKNDYQMTATLQNADKYFGSCSADAPESAGSSWTCTTTGAGVSITAIFIKGTTRADYYVANTAGTYKIVYTWVNPGTTVVHKASRTVRVIDTSDSGAKEAMSNSTIIDNTSDTDSEEDSSKVYSLNGTSLEFTKDSTPYNTGLSLFETDHDWTIVLEGTYKGFSENYETLLDCMNEKSPFNGLTVRLYYNQTNLSAATNSVNKTFGALNTSKKFKLVLTRDLTISKNKIFYHYCTDESSCATSTTVDENSYFTYKYTPVNRTVQLGAAIKNDGTVYRHFIGTISRFDVYNEAKYE